VVNLLRNGVVSLLRRRWSVYSGLPWSIRPVSPKHVESTIKRVSALFDESKVRELINKVDVQLPETCEYIKIPEERKQLICKLVISRFNSLKALV
jgi:hypothetical protein